MGHLTALGADPDEALEHAHRALNALSWADQTTEDDR